MTIVKIAAALSIAGLLAACDDKPTCTEESATAKMEEIMTQVQALATSNPEKLAALAPRMQEIQAQMADAGNDPQAACDALDAIAAELAE